MFDDIKKSLAERMARGQAELDKMEQSSPQRIMPGDENIPAPNLRNYLTEKLSLPFDKQTLAEEKQAIKDLPQNIGMGTVGSIAKVLPARQAMMNIIKKVNSGQGLDAAEQLTLNATKSKAGMGPQPNVIVQPTAQDLAYKKAMDSIKTPVKRMGAGSEPSSSVINVADGEAKKLLPRSQSMDQMLDTLDFERIRKLLGK